MSVSVFSASRSASPPEIVSTESVELDFESLDRELSFEIESAVLPVPLEEVVSSKDKSPLGADDFDDSALARDEPEELFEDDNESLLESPFDSSKSFRKVAQPASETATKVAPRTMIERERMSAVIRNSLSAAVLCAVLFV